MLWRFSVSPGVHWSFGFDMAMDDSLELGRGGTSGGLRRLRGTAAKTSMQASAIVSGICSSLVLLDKLPYEHSILG